MNKILKKGLSFFLAIAICLCCNFGVLGNCYSATESMNVEDFSIVLPENLPIGKYVLRYENNGEILVEYARICTLEVDDSGESVFYDKFIEANTAPVDATSIGIYNQANERVGEISLGELKSTDMGSKLYSFAAFSDVHIGSKTAESDFQNALEYVENNPEIAFTTICGDFIHSITEISQLEKYKNLVDTYTTKPIYAISGNHEAGSSNLDMETLKPYTGQDLYYSFTYGNDVFIMIGNSGCTNGNLFADGELQWLYDTLEANKDKRCFVFQHVRPNQGSGNPWGIYDYKIWGGTEAKVFESLMAHYPNVIFFHGHTHMSFGLQTKDNLANYDNLFGYHSVHIPSLSRPRTGDERGPISRRELTDASEGYVVDVYEDGVVLKGRDFISGEFLPVASYALNTATQIIDANTYYDPTGTIINDNCNVLKAGGAWYNSATPKSEITEISFVKSYNGNSDEIWYGGLNDNEAITVYREDTELFIVGNKNGIVANANSAEMFSGFTNLTAINGFENLKKSNITSIEGMFKNCNKLLSIDFSSFTGVQPVNMANVFSDCHSLTEIDLSYLDLSVARQYLGVFNNCKNLKNVTFGEVTDTNVYMSGSFKGCSSIETVDLSCFSTGINLGSTFDGCISLKKVKFPDSFSVLALNSCFNNCASLETLDISGFDISQTLQMNSVFYGCTSLKNLILPEKWDTSNVTTMYSMFCNCPLLTLDCSDWNVKNSVDLYAFKVGSPGVIAPEHAENTEIKEPTCTEQGYTIHSCSVCGYNYSDSFVDMLGHSVEEWKVLLEPSCTLKGEKEGLCSVCGNIVTKDIDALGHNYSNDWCIDLKPTCTENGSKSRHCFGCDNKTDITTILPVGHTEVWDEAIVPTCTTDGKTEGSHCSVCDEVIIEQIVVPAIGHDYKSEITKKATHLATGLMTYTCECGDNYTEIIEKTPEHSYEKTVTAPSCTEQGYTTYTCECGDDYISDYTDETGHTTSDWIVEKQADCITDGYKYKECTVCDLVVETATISAKGHTEVKDAAVAATCITAGKTEGSHCSVCNAVIKAQTTVPAKGHNPTDWIVDKAATVSAPGSKHKECTTCKVVLETATIPQHKPATPKAATTNEINGINVKWNTVEGAVKYNVYRRQAGQTAWTLVGTTTGTAITDTKVTSGTFYCYSVRAYNNADQYSDYVAANTQNRKYMATPKLTGISNATNGIYIKWNAVSGVTEGYRVYRRGAGQTTWTYLGTVKTTYYTDTQVKSRSGEYYRYTVIADGGYHSKFDTNGLYLKRLANPALKSATSATAGITVKWSAINGTTGYYVYRKTVNSNWVRIAAVGGTNTTSYLDKTAKKGINYTYTVRAVYGSTTSYFDPGISCKDKY